MWQLRAEQWAALLEDRLQVSTPQTVAFLREEAPEVVGEADDAEVLDFALRCARKAIALGFEDPYCLQQLTLFAAWYGEGLWEAPWAKRILANSGLAEQSKVARMEDYLLTKWEGAR